MAASLLGLALWTAAALLGLMSAMVSDFQPGAEAPAFEVWREPEGNYGDDGVRNDVRFPLMRTEVDATVASGVVHAKVTQMYRNDGAVCLQSRYIFPLPVRAAISAMTMRIGDRTVEANIRNRSTAREEFEHARAAGQAASLLEQERPNVFAMELANILPGAETEVIVEYVELLAPIDGIYAFTFPTVVGPRYVGEGHDQWAPGSDTSDLATHVEVRVYGSVLGFEASPPLFWEQAENGSTVVKTDGQNTDIVVSFWFTEAAVGAQLLLGTFGQDRFFLLGVQPPQRRLLDPAQISKREFLFILDVSGSMTGYPIDLSKQLLRSLLQENVRADDGFNIMLFAGGSAVFNDRASLQATNAHVSQALDWLDTNMFAGGGTNLLPALVRAFAFPRLHEHAARTIIIMTDGYVTVEQEAFDLVRASLGEGNVFVFGVGSPSVNHFLIEGLARVGQGEPFVVPSRSQGQAVALQLQRCIDTPVLTRLSLTIEGVETRALEPPHLADVFASRPILVVGKWVGAVQPQARVRLAGRLADASEWEYAADIATLPVVHTPVLPLVWARARIAFLSDYARLRNDRSNEEEVTTLGLRYSLMTPYTSFVAVDSHPSSPDICLGNNTNRMDEPEQEVYKADEQMFTQDGTASARLPLPTLIYTRGLLSALLLVASLRP